MNAVRGDQMLLRIYSKNINPFVQLLIKTTGSFFNYIFTISRLYIYSPSINTFYYIIVEAW